MTGEVAERKMGPRVVQPCRHVCAKRFAGQGVGARPLLCPCAGFCELPTWADKATQASVDLGLVRRRMGEVKRSAARSVSAAALMRTTARFLPLAGFFPSAFGSLQLPKLLLALYVGGVCRAWPYAFCGIGGFPTVSISGDQRGTRVQQAVASGRTGLVGSHPRACGGRRMAELGA